MRRPLAVLLWYSRTHKRLSALERRVTILEQHSIAHEQLRVLLDDQISHWRAFYGESDEDDEYHRALARHYIAAHQSIRYSVLGARKP